MPACSAVPDLVRRCIQGIGALLYRFEWWKRFFSRMLKTPSRVSKPALPLEILDVANSVAPR